MPRRSKVRVKLGPIGVDIVDRNGELLCGITNQEAVDIAIALSKKLGRIVHRAWLDAGKPIRGKPTAKRR